jgi:hypothetical protein
MERWLAGSQMDGRLLGFGVKFEVFIVGLDEMLFAECLLDFPEGIIDGTELGNNFSFRAAVGEMVAFKFLLEGFYDCFNTFDGFEDGLGESQTICMGILVSVREGNQRAMGTFLRRINYSTS